MRRLIRSEAAVASESTAEPSR